MAATASVKCIPANQNGKFNTAKAVTYSVSKPGNTAPAAAVTAKATNTVVASQVAAAPVAQQPPAVAQPPAKSNANMQAKDAAAAAITAPAAIITGATAVTDEVKAAVIAFNAVLTELNTKSESKTELLPADVTADNLATVKEQVGKTLTALGRSEGGRRKTRGKCSMKHKKHHGKTCGKRSKTHKKHGKRSMKRSMKRSKTHRKHGKTCGKNGKHSMKH